MNKAYLELRIDDFNVIKQVFTEERDWVVWLEPVGLGKCLGNDT